MNLVIICENEEDLYAGIEHWQTSEVHPILKLITRPGCEKIKPRTGVAASVGSAQLLGYRICQTECEAPSITLQFDYGLIYECLYRKDRECRPDVSLSKAVRLP